MRLVKQESWNDCAPACLAMVTGVPITNVKAFVPVPTTHAEMYSFLFRRVDDVHLITILDEIKIRDLKERRDLFRTNRPFEERTMILTVAAPYPEVLWHAIVVHEGKVLDPTDEWRDIDEINGVSCTWGFDIELDSDL